METEELLKASPNGSGVSALDLNEINEMKAALVRERVQREQAFIKAVSEAVNALSEQFRCDFYPRAQLGDDGHITAIFQARARE